MNWFIKKKIKPIDTDRKVKVTEGMWEKCQNCKEIVYKKEIERNYRVCPKCNYDNELGRIFCHSCGAKLDLTKIKPPTEGAKMRRRMKTPLIFDGTIDIN